MIIYREQAERDIRRMRRKARHLRKLDLGLTSWFAEGFELRAKELEEQLPELPPEPEQHSLFQEKP